MCPGVFKFTIICIICIYILYMYIAKIQVCEKIDPEIQVCEEIA